jgi:hypothetical protein
MIGPWGRPRGMRVALRNLGQVRAVALRARDLLGISHHPINMVDLLENRLRRAGIHFHIVDADAIPGEAARALPEKGRLLVTQEAYDGIHAGDSDHTLLVPHEIGHFALDHAASFARSNLRDHGIWEDSEIQADQFSHEFLMPVSLVMRHCMSWADIQRVFGIQAKEARLRHLVLRLEGQFDD